MLRLSQSVILNLLQRVKSPTKRVGTSNRNSFYSDAEHHLYRRRTVLADTKSTNITWHEATITRENREKLLDQKGCVLWFTGLSSSGKSTLALEVENTLHGRGRLTYVLDGDNVRHGLNKNLGFSPEDREENIRRIGEGVETVRGFRRHRDDRVHLTLSCGSRHGAGVG